MKNDVITPKTIVALSLPPNQIKQENVAKVISIGVIHMNEKLKT